MPKRLYTSINCNNLPNDIIVLVKEHVNELWNLINPESNKCLLFNEYLVIKNNLKEPLSITVKSPNPQPDPLFDIPNEYKAELEELIKKYNLKGKEIAALKKELQKTEFELLEYKKKIKILREKAKNTATERDRKKVIKKLESRSNKFMASLKESKCLNNDQKIKVKEKLEVVTDSISDAYTYLD